MRTTAKMGSFVLLVATMMGCGEMAPMGAAGSPRYHTQQQPSYPAATAAPMGVVAAAPTAEIQGTEAYKDHGVNPTVDPTKDRFSTFAIDVDTASYAIARRKLLEGGLPPYQAVRAEEFLNYFKYNYEQPDSDGQEQEDRASMGPLLDGSGDHVSSRTAIMGQALLQWGRSSTGAVTDERRVFADARIMALQWGRSSTGAVTATSTGTHHRSSMQASMGPLLDGSGDGGPEFLHDLAGLR